MSKSVNVDFVTRQIEVDTDGKEHFISAAMAAKDAEQSMLNAQNAANKAENMVASLPNDWQSTVDKAALAELKTQGFVTPEMFGAVGDGVTDDTQAIQRAIDYASTVKGLVFLKGTEYNVSHLEMKSNVCFIGSGYDNSIIKCNSTFECGLNVSPYTDNFILKGFKLLGNNGNTKGLNIENSKGKASYKNCYIEEIKIQGFYDAGMYIDIANYNTNISNCYIYNCGIGAVIYATDMSVDNVYIERCRKDGIKIYGGNNKISRIKTVWNGIDDPHNCWAFFLYTSRCQVTNIEAQDNFCNGIQIWGDENQATQLLSDCNGYENDTTYYPSTPFATLLLVTGTRNKVDGICTQYNSNKEAVADWGLHLNNANECIVDVKVNPHCCQRTQSNNPYKSVLFQDIVTIQKLTDFIVPFTDYAQVHTINKPLSYSAGVLYAFMQGAGGCAYNIYINNNVVTATKILGQSSATLAFTVDSNGYVIIQSDDVNKVWKGIYIGG